MSAKQVLLARLKRKSQVDFHVAMIIYQYLITSESILRTILDSKTIRNSFQSGLGKPLNTDSVTKLKPSAIRRLEKRSDKVFPQTPFPRSSQASSAGPLGHQPERGKCNAIVLGLQCVHPGV